MGDSESDRLSALRQALLKVNADALTTVSTVTLPSNGSHYLVDNTKNDILIRYPVTINGGGASSTVIDAHNGTSVGQTLFIGSFSAQPATFTLNDLSIVNATHGAGGGAINFGAGNTTTGDVLNLNRVVIKDNTASSGNGAGLPKAQVVSPATGTRQATSADLERYLGEAVRDRDM